MTVEIRRAAGRGRRLLEMIVWSFGGDLRGGEDEDDRRGPPEPHAARDPRSMMRRLLDDAHERGEPLAALFASEGAIYGRFGFGWAVDDRHVEAERMTFREPAHPAARVRLLAPPPVPRK